MHTYIDIRVLCWGNLSDSRPSIRAAGGLVFLPELLAQLLLPHLPRCTTIIPITILVVLLFVRSNSSSSSSSSSISITIMISTLFYHTIMLLLRPICHYTTITTTHPLQGDIACDPRPLGKCPCASD